MVQEAILLQKSVVHVEHKPEPVDLSTEVTQIAYCERVGLPIADLPTFARLVVGELEESLIEQDVAAALVIDQERDITTKRLRQVTNLDLVAIGELVDLALLRRSVVVNLLQQLSINA